MAKGDKQLPSLAEAEKLLIKKKKAIRYKQVDVIFNNFRSSLFICILRWFNQFNSIDRFSEINGEKINGYNILKDGTILMIKVNT